jgi:hypothetical protein
MTESLMNQLRTRLDGIDARSVLVRGASAPARPPKTVTVAPGVVARTTFECQRAPIRVTAEAASGRTIRSYDGTDARAAADRATALVAEREPEAVWLCDRERIASWWSDGVTSLLERRLDDAARAADARLVVWTTDEDEGTGEETEAVEDRYDVVLDP